MNATAPHSAPADPPSTESDSSNPGPPRSASFRADHLHRKREDRMVAGVAGGMAEYFDIDPSLVRVAFVALTFVGGVAVPLYLAAWLLVPEEGSSCSVGEELLTREPAR